MGRFHINKTLLPLKVHYFFINAGCAGVMPFLPVYAMQLGIKADVVGYIYACLCCLTFLSKPLIGSVTDHFQNIKTVIVILLLTSTAADMGENFIPQPKKEQTNLTVNLICAENITYLINYDITACDNNTCVEESFISCLRCPFNHSSCSTQFIQDKTIHFRTSISSSNYDLFLKSCYENNTILTENKCSEIANKTSAESNLRVQVLMFTIFTGFIYISYGSISSLSDAACFSVLGAKPELYGKQRLWGAVGWGTFAFISGILNQTFTKTANTYNYSPGFYILLVFFLIDIAVISNIKLIEVKVQKNFCNVMSRLLIQSKVILFITQVFFIGIFVGLSRSYLFWYLRYLKASQTLLGAVSLVQCFLGELPFFFVAAWLIKYIGHLNTFSLSFIANAIKFVIYYFMINPFWALFIEVLQGPIFGSFYTAMASYAKIVAPDGTEATVQGIASGAFESLGIATGSLLGGFGIRLRRKIYFSCNWCIFFDMWFDKSNCQ